MKHILTILLLGAFLTPATAQTDDTQTDVTTSEVQSGEQPDLQPEPTITVAEHMRIVEVLQQEKAALQRQLKDKDDEIRQVQRQKEKAEQRLAFADTLLIRLSNDCFRFKYDSARVEHARTQFSQIYSKTLQRHFSPLKTLLDGYGQWYAEIVTTLKDAADDYRDNIRAWQGSALFKGAAEKPCDTFIARIRQSEYYRNHYGQNWSIMYLDNLIEQAVARLKTYEQKKEKALSFDDLLEE